MQIGAGNRNAYDDASWENAGVDETRALRFIPIRYVGQPCMRVLLWGKSKLLRPHSIVTS